MKVKGRTARRALSAWHATYCQGQAVFGSTKNSFAKLVLVDEGADAGQRDVLALREPGRARAAVHESEFDNCTVADTERTYMQITYTAATECLFHNEVEDGNASQCRRGDGLPEGELGPAKAFTVMAQTGGQDDVEPDSDSDS